MSLDAADMNARVDQHFAYEARDDVEGVLATLAEDVEHDVVGWPGGPVRGRAAARAFHEATFSDLAEGRVETLRRLHGSGFVIDDAIWRGTAPGRPFGLEGRGRPVAFRLLHVIEFDDAGAIRRENVWIDLAAVQRQLPQD